MRAQQPKTMQNAGFEVHHLHQKVRRGLSEQTLFRITLFKRNTVFYTK